MILHFFGRKYKRYYIFSDELLISLNTNTDEHLQILIHRQLIYGNKKPVNTKSTGLGGEGGSRTLARLLHHLKL